MKKLLSIITIVLFISMLNGITTTMAASEKNPIMGDVDQSGQVDAQDAVQILKYVAHNIELSEDALKVANVDGIGKVDAQDAVMILKYVAHNITAFPGINFEALEIAKNDAKQYKESDYSVASYKVLKDALAMLETTQNEVDIKVKAIRNAIAGLKTDASTLNTAKAEAAKYKEEDYSAASYKKLQDALKLPEKTQKEIDAKVSAITNAIAGLNTNTSKLSEAKIEAAKCKEEDYSAASYKKLQDALKLPEKTQVEIDAKEKAITNAIAGLTIDASALNTAKSDAAKRKEEDYSKISYKALKDALDLPETTQKEIDSKVKAIRSAIAGLKTDVVALNAAKKEAAKYAEADYSVESYKVLTDALKLPETTQKEIDSKEKAITSAIAGLRTDDTRLKEAEIEAAKYAEADYSVASYKALQDALAMAATTQKQIDDKTAAITTAINGLEKKLAHVNVTTSQKTVIRDKQLNIATITSGDKEEKIAIENLEFNIIYTDLLGVETEISSIDNEFVKIDKVPDNGAIVVNFIGKKVGTYTINVNVGTISGSQEIKVTVDDNEEVNYAELDGTIPETITVNQILSELGINFYHKYTDTDKLPNDSVWSNDLTLEYTGMTVTLLDENKDSIEGRNAEVKYITIEFTKAGNLSLKIKYGGQTILNKIFTVQAETVNVMSVKLYDKLFETEGASPKEINTINLYTSNQGDIPDCIKVETYYEEDEDEEGNEIQVEYNDIYTLIPIYLDDGKGNRTKINAGNIVNEIEEGKIKIGYYVNNTEQPTKIMPKYFYINENGEIKETTNLDIDYIGIAISNKKNAQELNNGKIKIIYEGREYIFSINAK